MIDFDWLLFKVSATNVLFLSIRRVSEIFTFVSESRHSAARARERWKYFKSMLDLPYIPSVSLLLTSPRA